MLHCVSTLWVTVCPHLRTQCVTLCVHTVEILLQRYQHCENGPNPHSRHTANTAFSPCCYDVYHHVATLCITMLPHCVSPCCHTAYVSPCCHTVIALPHCKFSPVIRTLNHTVYHSVVKNTIALPYTSATCCYMQFSLLAIITRYYN